MADYTSQYTGLQIDEALTSALNVKRVRGLIKMTDDGPVAAVPGEDFPDGSGSTVSVTGLLKGVRNEDTNEIEVQQATAGADYQTPLTAGADYATPTAVANKQSKITAQGLLKGLGDGSVVEATSGTDYQSPIPAGTYAAPAILRTVTLGVVAWTGAEAPFTQIVTVNGVLADSTKQAIIVSPAGGHGAAYGAAGIECTVQATNALTFTCTVVPDSDITVNISIQEATI